MPKKKMSADRLVVQNAAKTLLANIRFSSLDNPIRVITVTSATPNEGKSTVALNLAQAIATSGKRVALVECDMRRRSMADMLGIHSRGGLYAVLSEQMRLEDAVVETSQKNLFFLDAEPHIPNPADIIASKRFSRLIATLKSTFQYVIFDTPPVGTFIDAAEVGRQSDGVLFVIRENFTKRNEIVAAVDQLRKAEVNIIGAVMNYCETETSDYYYSYYTKDGKKVRTSEGSSDAAPTIASGSSTAAAGVRRGGAGAGVQGVVPSASGLSNKSRFSR